MNWFDDDLAQESARWVDGIVFTVYMTVPRHEWTVMRILGDGSKEWCGRYFPTRDAAKTAAFDMDYMPSSVPEPELNEALVRVLERNQKAAGA